MATELRVYIVTWNVGDAGPPDDLTRLLNLDSKHQPAIYAIGLQEMKSGWTDLAYDAFYDDPWTIKVDKVLVRRGYVRIKSLRLIGIHETVYVQKKYLPFVTNVESEYTRTGLGGMWGNKGGVSIRLCLCGVNICFVNCHFQAHRYNYLERLQDYDDMIDGQSFRDQETPTILDHDYVFWFGDLNFRIDELPRHEVIKRVKEKDYDYLLKYDQLINAMKEEKILLEFEEGPITFDPTYKYDFGSDEYDTSKKQRIPSWCDRILWKVSTESFENFQLGVKQLSYTALPVYRDSDHKPVISEFLVRVLSYPPPLPVQFLPIDSWMVKRDCICKFSILNDVFKESIWDWIGLYKAGFKDIKDYTSYVYPPKSGIAERGGETLYKVKFDDYKLKVKPGMYYLGYFSQHQNCLVGFSDPFSVVSKRGSSVDDLSETSSASSSDSD